MKRLPVNERKLVDDVQSLWRSGQQAAALDLLVSTAESLPVFSSLHGLRLDLLLSAGRRLEARQAFDQMLARYGASNDALDGLAFYARRLELHELSNVLYRRAVDAMPLDAQLWYNFATSERSLGRLSSAAEASERALRLDSAMLPALLLRSELSTATETDNHVDELKARLAQDPSDRGQLFAAYALGKELHDLGRYDAAFAAFTRGAALRRRNLAYDVADDEQKLARIREVFHSAPARTASTGSSRRHIFIIGLPRSGTTLTERILGALPGVRSNGETDNFSTALISCAPQGPGDVFARCAAASPEDIARAYEGLVADGPASDRIIEKLPLNYLYIGPIAAALPDASIIWVRRNPVDSCFAMFRTLFGQGYPFSYDFRDLARYHAAYDRLMRHWSDVFSGRLIEVYYEDLVKAPEAVGRRVAQACGLPWRKDALDLSGNRSPSLTASAAQVRGAIYATSAGVWRRYGERLAPLREELRRHGVQIDGP